MITRNSAHSYNKFRFHKARSNFGKFYAEPTYWHMDEHFPIYQLVVYQRFTILKSVDRKNTFFQEKQKRKCFVIKHLRFLTVSKSEIYSSTAACAAARRC